MLVFLWTNLTHLVYNVNIYNANKNRASNYNIGQSFILVNQGDATFSFQQVIPSKNKVIIKSFFQQTDERQI